MDVTTVRLLSSLCLLAIIVQAQDCSRPVGGANMDLKGNNILLEEFPEGTKVTFACNPGYVSKGGSPSITCTTGNWSSLGMSCERRSCGVVGEVENGQIDYQPGNEFGDKAVVTCNTGYVLVGKDRLVCGVQGWEGRLPVCDVVQCESPPQILYGSFSPVKSTYDYNEVVQYTCKRDYTLNGSNPLACSDDGTFKPDRPKCILVKCVEPEIPNGLWSSGARPPYGYLSAVILECRPGYRMIGSATQKCEKNSQWSPGLPQCIVECKDPKSINPQVTVSRQPPYRRLDQVTVSCHSGESKSQQFTVRCQENGLWDPEIPKKCETEGNGGDGLHPGLIFLIVVAVLGTLGLIYFGMRRYNKKKGARRGNTDKEATKEGEDVALS
ncbi:complement receptor type 1-like isoform X3 [Archocentrus centrarchus]|uniref:complement receptor type 1-like isoform X3 n=1 Tax=Archocentrus centrarchus TaxID=63155 RepID=UPI0011E9CC64|nr:complement receptor type 1-like isoform X3 [Archocentrus centrarchus]